MFIQNALYQTGRPFKVLIGDLCGLTYRSPSTGQTGKSTLHLSVMGPFAEFERALLRERQREGIALAKQREAYRGRRKSPSPKQVLQLRQRVRYQPANPLQLPAHRSTLSAWSWRQQECGSTAVKVHRAAISCFLHHLASPSCCWLVALFSSRGKNASISSSEKVMSSDFWSATCAFL